jgi:Fur family ferric uptake transcriptional regulator
MQTDSLGHRASILGAPERQTARGTALQDQDIRNAGLKVTEPRRRILEIFEQGRPRHLSAEDVYRLLAQFETAGLLTRHHFEGGLAVFELKEGPIHDHVVCLHCGRVEEFSDRGIEARQSAIAQHLGYTISERSLVLYGCCAECESRKTGTSNA